MLALRRGLCGARGGATEKSYESEPVDQWRATDIMRHIYNYYVSHGNEAHTSSAAARAPGGGWVGEAARPPLPMPLPMPLSLLLERFEDAEEEEG